MKPLRPTCCLLLLALLVQATPAAANSTICSNPKRAGVRARMSVDLPGGGAAQLEGQIKAIARTRLGMSAGVGSYEDPYKTPPLSGRDLSLRSPDESVVILIETTNRDNRARISVQRTCYYDAQVPWQPYWRALSRFLRASGYRIRHR
jgi:hypothetical protein